MNIGGSHAQNSVHARKRKRAYEWKIYESYRLVLLIDFE